MHFTYTQILNSDHWKESLQEFVPDKFKMYMDFRKKVGSSLFQVGELARTSPAMR